jgi:hypothetical protein
MDPHEIINRTRNWIAKIVIELNLCPFARAVFVSHKIRYALTDVESERELLHTLKAECARLLADPAIETTLIIHPKALLSFVDYNAFLPRAERHLSKLGHEGVFQIASFHPEYQFADADPDAVENYTNRSPYPMLHLLREESISAIADDEQTLLEIPERNIETLRNLGKEEILRRLENL